MVVDNFLYMPATSAGTGLELWRIDLEPLAGPVSIPLEILPGANSSNVAALGNGRIAVVGGVVYFTAAGGPEGQQLWRYTPNAQSRTAVGSVSRVLDLNQQGISGVTELISVDGTLLLQRGTDTCDSTESTWFASQRTRHWVILTW